ncbi:MAG: nucleotidyltransferase domain-containing protein [Nocardioides sp.]|nr:nucleotidyltransferase domain-containing protein [Nocardioides sp.]
MRAPAVDAARALVAELFPDAVQAWLAGSTTTGRATKTSDLDITVLLEHGEVRRESLEYDGWPVELFVHTEASVAHFVAQDLARRRPTMARLVAEGVPLLDPTAGEALRSQCQEVLDRGPGPVPDAELELLRYLLTDLLDDLAGAGHDEEATAVAVAVWQQTAELALAAAETWSGTGKWLVRELAALDAARRTHLTAALDLALHRALAGERASLTAVADDVLADVGGRRWVGFRSLADLPATP